MKYLRHQFNEDAYQLWEKGIAIPVPQSASSYVVKYSIGEVKEYSLIEISAQNLDEALKQACFRIAKDSPVSPEDVDLQALYDLEGQLLWEDNLPYTLANSKSDERGMNRREFLTAFGLTNAALLFGLPKISQAATTSVSLAGTASGLNYVDDVFSTYLYNGNSSTLTINNGIDLAGKGGLVWIKSRSGNFSTGHNCLQDTARGSTNDLFTNLISGQAIGSNRLTSFNSAGFNLGLNSDVNDASTNYVSWTFRKAAKFFDIVTYTGDGSANRTISHALGTSPGLIIVKCTNASKHWVAGHYSGGTLNVLHFDSDRGPNWQGTPSACHLLRGVDSTTFTVSKELSSYEPWAGFGDVAGATNESGNTYVAYLFAHDSSTDGVIQCGSFTIDGSGNAAVNLGWEPQFLITKTSSRVESWRLFDTLRGLHAKPIMASSQLYPDLSNAEYTGGGRKFFSS